MKDGAAFLPWPFVVALGLLLYAVFLAATAPAAAMAWALDRATQGAMTLHRPGGGLWAGHAAALLIDNRGNTPQRIRQVTWDVLGLRLLRGQLAFALTLEDPRARGSAVIALRPRSVWLTDSALTVSAPLLAAFFPILGIARPGGELSARTGALIITESSVAGKAEIEWTDASSGLSKSNPLGTYKARMSGTSDGISFDVLTVNGALQIEGSGSWSHQKGPSFSGTARAQPPHSADLQELLRLLGRDDGSGVHRFQYAGSK